MDKSTTGVKETQMFGHKISNDGIFVRPDRVAAIQNLPDSTTIRELRNALGLIHFQRRFIKNTAKTLVPLTDYLQEKIKNNGCFEQRNQASVFRHKTSFVIGDWFAGPDLPIGWADWSLRPWRIWEASPRTTKAFFGLHRYFQWKHDICGHEDLFFLVFTDF